MRRGFDTAQTGTPFRFDISPLAGLRPQEPRWHTTGPYYTVVLLEGTSPTQGLVTADKQAFSELYFGRPGETALLTAQAGAQGQFLRFTDEFVNLTGPDRELLLFSLFQRATTGPVRLPAAQAGDLNQLFASMKRLAAGDPLLRDDLLRSYLRTVLLHCTRLSQQQYRTPGLLVQLGLFGRFQQLLEAHFTRWKSVAEYAEQLSVTANHLSVSIKKETGRPASEHIRQRIMLEAKRLVSSGDVPLKEVAYQLGFEDVSHFSKLFKRCTGTTFSDFKGQARAQYHYPALDLMAA